MKTVISIKQNNDSSCIMIDNSATEELKNFLKSKGFSEVNLYSKINMFETSQSLNFSMIKELEKNFQINSDDVSIFFVTAKEQKEYFEKLNSRIS